MSFICHIHNYTEYNQQWNVFSAFNPSKTTHTLGGSHLSRGQFLPEPRFEPTTSGYKSDALSIRAMTAHSHDQNPPWLWPKIQHDCDPKSQSWWSYSLSLSLSLALSLSLSNDTFTIIHRDPGNALAPLTGWGLHPKLLAVLREEGQSPCCENWPISRSFPWRSAWACVVRTEV